MLKSLWNKAFSANSENISENVLLKSLFTISLKGFSSGIGVITFWLLSKLLSVDGVGYYQYAFTWVAVLVFIGLLGFDRLLLRKFAQLHAEGKDAVLVAIFKWSNKFLFTFSVIISAIVIGISLLPLEVFEAPEEQISFQLGILSIPLFILVAHRRAALVGMKEVVPAQIPEKFIQPIVQLTGLLFIYLWVEGQVSAPTALIVQLVAISFSFISSHLIYLKKAPKVAPDASQKEPTNLLLKAAMPFLIYNLAMVAAARLDILMLRPMVDANAVGLYSIPMKLATFVGFILFAFNNSMAANVTELYHKKDLKGLQTMVAKANRAVVLIGTIAATLLILGREPILEFFDEAYVAGAFTLIILLVGQVFNLIIGPVGNLLIMTKYEWLATICFSISMVANFVLNLILIPKFGIEGAAYATTASMVIQNLLMLTFVVKRLKINPTIFARTYR